MVASHGPAFNRITPETMSDLTTLFGERQRRSLSRTEPTPLYHQLYALLKSIITNGTLPHGEKLPTEEQLARLFEVSRITSRRAMDELFREGLVSRQRGKGSYVRYRVPPRPFHAPMVGMLQEMESIGRFSTARVLECSMRTPPLDVRSEMGLKAGEPALYLARVRSKDGMPFGYYTSWTVGVETPSDLGEFRHTPRMALFRRQGLEVAFIKQILTARAAESEAAEALELEPGDSVLSLTRLGYPTAGGDGNAVDFLRVQYHPERFEYHIDLDLEESRPNA